MKISSTPATHLNSRRLARRARSSARTLQTRLAPVAIAVSLVLVAPASLQVAYAGPGKVCIDSSIPNGNLCTDGSTPIGTYYANSPPLRKFVDTLAGLTAAGANTFASGVSGEYIPIAEPDVVSYPGSEYFVIGVVEHDQRMHSDLQKATTQRSYVQLYPPLGERGAGASNPPTPAASAYAAFGAPNPGAPVALTYPNGNPIYWPGTTEPVYAYDKARYLGPIIITPKGTPVRIKFVNFLPTGRAATTTVSNPNGATTTIFSRNGDMFLPVDESLAGAGLTPTGDKYPQNRVVFHLHGGDSPWISDGTPHQWITAAGDSTPYKRGDRLVNTPDMPYPGEGGLTTFWPNDQSSRLMWYHDHAFGLTRQNVYVGAAAGYVLYDAAELALIYGGTVNGVAIKKAIPNTLLEQIVLVVQDKTFVPNDIAVQDSKWDVKAWGKPGDLWFPHVYEPIQIWDKAGNLGSTTPGQLFDPLTNPATPLLNPAGRWDYGIDDATGGYRVPNAPLRIDPDYGNVAFPDGSYTGGPSATPESYMDTPVVNGIAYPVLNVEPKAYRVRFLNGANDRYWNLSLWVADGTQTSTDGRTNTEIKMVPADGTVTFGLAGGGSYTPVDNRAGGVPDPASAGPNIIRFANEGGLLAAPVVHKPSPMNGFDDPAAGFTLVRDDGANFYLGSAERADTVIDFSQYAGRTLILYNDSAAPVPGGDSRYDYYTGGPDQTSAGGAPSTLAGYGPNTRTVMQIRVAATLANGGAAGPAYDPASTGGALATELPKAYKASTDPHIFVPPTATPTALPTLDAAASTITLPGTTTPIALKVKTLRGLTDPNFGRLIAQIGYELNTPTPDPLGTPLTYVDAPNDIISDGETQYWWIKNNDVDNHPMHFHLFNVQVVARLDHASGALLPPQPDERGWKETIKNWPLEDVIVAIKPKTPALPFGLPKSVRNLDPTLPEGATNSSFNRPGLDLVSAFVQHDVFTGVPLSTVNTSADFNWEYVWHCHILGHEENDLMRPLVFHPVPPTVPATPPGSVFVDATGKVSWTDPTPALDAAGTVNAATKGNTDNEIGFRIERAVVTTSNATGTPTAGAFAALAPNSPVIDGRVNTLANATAFQDAPANFIDYAYRVVSVNEGGTVESNAATLAQAPATPTSVAVDATGKVTWSDASSNETGFRVERAQITTPAGVGAFSPVGTVTANVMSLQDAPLPNTDYQYRVFAVNASATVADSTASAAAALSTLPTAPSISGVDAAGAVTWIDYASNETGFFVERATVTTSTTGVQSVGAWSKISGTTNLAPNTQTFAGTALAVNTDYRFRVTAVNAKGNTVSPDFNLSATVPAAVGSVSVSSAGVVTWLFSSTSSVTNYQVNRAVVTSGVAGAFTTLATLAGTLDTYTDATVAANTDYQYQVVALKGTTASTTNAVATLAQAPKSPTGLAVSAVTGTGLTLSWVDNSTNEDGFSAESSSDSGLTWIALTATPVAPNVVTYAATGLVPGGYYSFRVAATKNLAGYVPTYTTTPVTYTPATLVAPVVTALSSLVNGASQALVTWTSTSVGQTGFTVERCAGTTATCAVATANWTFMATVSGTTLSYLDTTLAASATYVYRVKAVATNTLVTPNVTTAGPLARSGQTASAVDVAAPGNLAAVSPTGVGVTLTWLDNSTNETSFNVYRSPAFAAPVSVARTTSLRAATGGAVTYADATAVAGAAYSYTVAAVNTTGTTVSVSPVSNTANITLALPAPTGLTAVQSGANVALTWTDTAATETSFEVLRTDPAGTTTTFTIPRSAGQTRSVNAQVTYTDVAAVPGAVYTYAVRAVNTPVVVAPAVALPNYSPYTANTVASVVIPAPTSLTTALPAAGAGYVLYWVDNATFETGYRIDRATVTLDPQGNVPAGTVYTTLRTLTRTGNVVTTTGAVAYTDLTATALAAPQVYAYQVYAVKTTAVPAPVGGVATTATSFSAPSNAAHTAVAVANNGAPTALTANTANGTSIVLSWIDNTALETAYQVIRTDVTNPAAPVQLITNRSVIAGTGRAGTWTDVTAVVGSSYTYQVVAVMPAPGPNLSSAVVPATLGVAAPTNAAVVQVATGVQVSWTDNSNTETGFQIVRTGVNAQGVAVAAATFNVTSTAAQKTAIGARTYIDTTAVPGITYTYTVAATSGTAAAPIPGPAISTAPVTITEVIAAPSTPSAVISNGTQITVTWTDLSTNETGFLVERSQDGGVTWVALPVAAAGAAAPLVTVTRTGTTGVNGAVSYVDNLVAPVVYGQYRYRVSAVNVTGRGATAVLNAASTAVASNILDFTLPAAPTALTATVTAGVAGVVKLTWVDNATSETGFTVERATNATFTRGLVTTAVPGASAATGQTVAYTLNGLPTGTSLFFRVAATHAAGTSTYVATPAAVRVP